MKRFLLKIDSFIDNLNYINKENAFTLNYSLENESNLFSSVNGNDVLVIYTSEIKDIILGVFKVIQKKSNAEIVISRNLYMPYGVEFVKSKLINAIKKQLLTEITEEDFAFLVELSLSSIRSLLQKDYGISFPSPSPLILFGPPGTGKTHTMQTDYIDKYPNHFVTTFHQSFSYEEFVEGLKAKANEKGDVVYEIEKGIFCQACEKAAELAGYGSLQEMIKDGGEKLKNTELNCGNTVLFCIDEINRANVSAVFGDLISLIEPSKRLGAEFKMRIVLPYSKEVFAVPKNLLIVGTMNTADRSIQLLDSALRRRFEFVELLPAYEKVENESARKLLEAINNRIRALLGKNYQIGHSYFINLKSDDGDEKILEVLEKNIIPLLEEYFYDEAEKIVAVLNDSNAHNFYVEDKEAEKFINSHSDYDNETKVYKRKEKSDKKDIAEIIANIIGKRENQ